MSSEAYRKLQEHLDRLPMGFPRTESGVEFEILQQLFAPEEAVDKMLNDIENDVINSLEKLERAFQSMYDNYSEYEWAWTANVLQQFLGKKIDDITPDDIIELTQKWKNAVINLDNQLYEDAKKEFTETAQTGYGIDGDEKTKHADFAEVRGTYEKDSFVLEIGKHIKNKTELAEELINRLKKLV